MKNMDAMIKNMPDVQNYQESLKSLSERWNLLTLLGQMSNIGMDMSETRAAFDTLSNELLNSLAKENIKKLTSEIASKAQVAVDIVIRNLFERTADIGFLATDDDIREYLKLQANSLSPRDNSSSAADKKKLLHNRFKEYVAKYSVYENIILLDISGEPLIQLDLQNRIENTQREPLIDEVLTTNKEYVEIFRHTELCPKRDKTLIYAYRVKESNEPDAAPLGVLCLVFRFENEMKGVFSKLKSESDWCEIALLDSDGVVISSSDRYHIPLGLKLEKVLHEDYKIVRFLGREYISKTCATKGYQGYSGLGWSGHIMIPLQNAFGEQVQNGAQLDSKILFNLLSSSNLFSDELKSIPIQAESIQRELDVTVWNGNVQIANTKTGDNSFSKSLLHEISKTGSQTKKAFENSIEDLNKTVITSYLDMAKFQSSLAIDIMDRNLYERANDCRWWALTTYFRNALSKPEMTPDERCEIGSILEYINGLYTVYTLLFIFDKNGTIVAVSNKNNSNLINTKAQGSWVGQILNSKDSSKYLVSQFEKSSYYDGRHTYIYSAPILHMSDGEPVGGIGIVFDSEPQFSAILNDALPTLQNMDDTFAIFVDKNRNIISSTNSKYGVGGVLNIDSPAIFSVNSGCSHAEILSIDGKYYVAGATACSGYREYKVSDGYKNDVVAMVFILVGDATIKTEEKKAIKEYGYPRVTSGEETLDVSTFYIGDKLFAIESSNIICSINGQNITPILGSNQNFLGVATFNGKTIGVVSIDSFLGYNTQRGITNQTIIVLQTEEGDIFGVIADNIKDSPEVPRRTLRDCEITLAGGAVLTKYIVQPQSGDEKKEMLSILNVDTIYYLLNKRTDVVSPKQIQR